MELSLPKHLCQLQEVLLEDYAFMAGIVKRSHAAFGPEWAREFDEIIERHIKSDRAIRHAVRGYANFALDAIRLQNVFVKTRDYAVKSYAQAAEQVYHNDEYMLNLYLPGILLSHYLWPHHYRQHKFFEHTFLPDVVRQGGVFADVGIGTGFFSLKMLRGAPNVLGRGFDISPGARTHALSLVQSFGLADRYDVQLQDVVQNTPESFADWLISVEVLEHLEDPESFLRALRKMLKPGGKAFITAALNAANADHIYLYRNPLEVADQLMRSGFGIEQYHSGMAYAPRSQNEPVPEITAFIVV